MRTALNEVRPRLQADGGDVELVEVRDARAVLAFQGSCVGCSMASLTLTRLLEQHLRQSVPELVAVTAETTRIWRGLHIPADQGGEVSAPSETYARQVSLPGFGAAAQRRLAESTVLIAGVGGLGGATATYLAAAGVGRLVLFHPGRLERADLNRQTLMTPSWIGHLRIHCAEATLRRHYPDVEVVAVPEPITADRTSPFLVQADVVVDARHNFPERLLLNRLCVQLGVPMVEAAMNGAEGQVSVVRPGQTACLACRYGDGDPGGSR